MQKKGFPNLHLSTNKKRLNSVALVRESDGSPRQYSRFSRPDLSTNTVRKMKSGERND
jgi:hypothetical protein